MQGSHRNQIIKFHDNFHDARKENTIIVHIQHKHGNKLKFLFKLKIKSQKGVITICKLEPKPQAPPSQITPAGLWIWNYQNFWCVIRDKQ